MSTKVIKIKGGLGNQLFQYAYGRNCIDQGEEIAFDISFFGHNKKDTFRPFLLNKFNISEDIVFVNQKQNALKKIISKFYSKITGNYKFYQSEKYFINIEKSLRKELTLKNPFSPIAQDFVNQITNYSNSVSIHIRRGDYITNSSVNKHHGTCGLDYYKNAILKIKEFIQSPIFFIFSDDIEWAKENLEIENAIYVSDPGISECEELVSMSYCKHNIIANSTFSWWGAWLNQNPDKVVIAPKQWTTSKTADELGILPKDWIQL